ncbi:hypothetical protein OJAV_G00011830 [Oryzias javanicus]|uniref:Uncharacterized protein n=1 Tax=Oryzias javanicus TaxID=123683 RepID=A0A3S2PII8_ORYJA|nr:hypothetical protein OJAV_G00011830 [Oryzias javanicus]
MQYRLVRKASASAGANAAGAGGGGGMGGGAVQAPKDELIHMKRTNGDQPFSCSTPSSPSHPSPAHKPQGGSVKKVTGVGGTTYEISV